MNTGGNRYRGARVLVLGAGGFIGAWVGRALVAEGAEVWSVVRPGSRGTLAGQAIEADICETRQLRDVFRCVKPGATFNLAGYGVDPSERDKDTAVRVNAQAVEEICRAAAEWRDPSWRGQALVHVGSALEYGEAGGDLRESSTPLPTTAYGVSKLAGTRAVERWSRSMKAATARLFTVYGAGEHAGRLLPSLLEHAAAGRPLPLTSGEQKRDFTYVEDAVEGLLRLGLCPRRGVGTVNLATGQLTTVREFVEIAAAALNMGSEQLRFGALPTRPEEMQHGPVNLDKLDGLLGWRPSLTIAEGIRRSLEQPAWRVMHAHLPC